MNKACKSPQGKAQHTIGGTQSPFTRGIVRVQCIKINQRRVVRNQGTTS